MPSIEAPPPPSTFLPSVREVSQTLKLPPDPAPVRIVGVIGANYGDEGKGVCTHYLTKNAVKPCVVRFNGGPQAGHTVRLKNGTRHVFSSYGSGTLAGSPTYLTEDVLVNPQAVRNEKNALETMGFSPALFVHPKCEVITPWDIALNQLLEAGRGPGKHGSCGMGIGETMLRKITKGAPRFCVEDISYPNKIFPFVVDIRKWFRQRLEKEGEIGSLDYLTPAQKNTLMEILHIPTRLMHTIWSFPAYSLDMVMDTKLPPAETIIFEGAQGLLLDEDNPDHQPHVSWSKTGAFNIVKECWSRELDLHELYYVTRPYITRHGAGPILMGLECENIWGEDATNVNNDFQGSLRAGIMDWGKFRSRVEDDVALAIKTGFDPKVHIALTCEDQIYCEEIYRFVFDGKETQIPSSQMVSTLQSHLPWPIIVIDGRNQ